MRMEVSVSQRTLKEYMQLPWEPEFAADPKGGVRLTVKALDDFELFADTEQELEGEWRDALESHLMAYLAMNKPIPDPSVRIVERSSVTSAGPSFVITLGRKFANFGIQPIRPAY